MNTCIFAHQTWNTYSRASITVEASTGVLTIKNNGATNNIHPLPDGVSTPSGTQFPPNLNLVTWDSHTDPENLQNWPRRKKLTRSAAPLAVIFSISFASSILGTSSSVTAHEYGVSAEVMSLGVALFVAGFPVGPLALAHVATILVCRFLADMLGSGGLAVESGILADIFVPITRGVAVGMSATIMNFGSIIGPIAGAYLVARYGWSWTAWVTLILCGAVGLLCVALLRESSHNRILMRRAARLRRETGNPALRARAEMGFAGPARFAAQVLHQARAHVLKPTAILPFIAVGLGVLTALGLFSLFTMTWYKRRWMAAQKASEGESTAARIAPEDRLPPMMLGAVLLPPALLWFGWAGHAHWAAQVVACYVIGLVLQIIFISGIVYIVDVYLLNTMSAISIHVMVRSVVSATFPLFEDPMYQTLHINWSATLLALLSAAIVISPVLLRIYGSRIRSWSRFFVGGI
ncbi:hypothetical protein NUU61_004610 [Penicillium alfredii]|uniref:Major facilitator superfamily (MFS) profile domain-containing protein n=1 Tax=Penicillium alfredii TaxID=1506179 RepID=A0A9W9KE46_9EURO|nr:uncharacterized protein NUU61_004610 [Penicillium alfredii]KAJ5102388.1 hypothetical protein NUU61_004610 [Penicillium alfredii]